MKRDHKPIKDIIILSAGNLNVGDHAILCSWLHFYRKLFGAHARITILGAEASYIAEQTCDLPCKVLVSNILHRYVWEHYEEKNHARVQNAVADLVETDRMILDRFDYAVSSLHQFFVRTDVVHIVGGGIINNKWKDVHYIIKAAVDLAKKYNKKVFMTGQTIGPLDELDQIRLRPVFEKVDLVDLRDCCCEKYLQTCGCPVNRSMDDVLLDLLPAKAIQKEDDLAPYIERPHINLCIQEWALDTENEKLYANAKKEIADFICWYCINHPQVHVNVVEFMPLDHDLRCGREVVDLMDGKIRNRCHYLCMANIRFLWGGALAVIQSAVLNIGTRYHLALFSMKKKIPTVSIVLDAYYEVKLRGIHDLFGSTGCLSFGQCTCSYLKQWMTAGHFYGIGTDLQRLKKAKLDQVMKMIGLERDWFWMRRVMDRI